MALYERETRHDHTALSMVSDTRDTIALKTDLALFLQEPDVEMDFVRPHTPYAGQTGVAAFDDFAAHFYGTYADDDDFVLKVNGTAVDRTVSTYNSGKLVQMVFGSALLRDDDADGDVDLYAEGEETNVGVTPKVTETWAADVAALPKTRTTHTVAAGIAKLLVADVTGAVGIKQQNIVDITGSVGFRPLFNVKATAAVPQRALAALVSEVAGRVFVGELVIFPNAGGTTNIAEVYLADDGSGTLHVKGTAIFDEATGSMEIEAWQLFDDAGGSVTVTSRLLFDDGSGSIDLGVLALTNTGGGTVNLLGRTGGISMGTLVIRVSTLGPRLAKELALAGLKFDWESPFVEMQSEVWIDEA